MRVKEDEKTQIFMRRQDNKKQGSEKQNTNANGIALKLIKIAGWREARIWK